MSAREMVHCCVVVGFGVVGLVLAIAGQDFFYIPALVECAALANAVVALIWAMTVRPPERRSAARGFVWVLALVLIIAMTSASAFLWIKNTELNRANSELTVANRELANAEAKLEVLTVINHEPRLIAAGSDEIARYFEPEAVIQDVGPRGQRYRGLGQIVNRYRNVLANWPYVSMHTNVSFIALKGDAATATATTSTYQPNSRIGWSVGTMKEVWRLRRGADGQWRIASFYYNIVPGNEREFVQRLH
jgi:hypothetical protein